MDVPREVIDKAIEDLDIKSIRKYMKSTGWKWAMGNEFRTPTKKELRKEARRLILLAIEKEGTEVATGGFMARYSSGTLIVLFYIKRVVSTP